MIARKKEENFIRIVLPCERCARIRAAPSHLTKSIARSLQAVPKLRKPSPATLVARGDGDGDRREAGKKKGEEEGERETREKRTARGKQGKRVAREHDNWRQDSNRRQKQKLNLTYLL